MNQYLGETEQFYNIETEYFLPNWIKKKLFLQGPWKLAGRQEEFG